MCDGESDGESDEQQKTRLTERSQAESSQAVCDPTVLIRMEDKLASMSRPALQAFRKSVGLPLLRKGDAEVVRKQTIVDIQNIKNTSVYNWCLIKLFDGDAELDDPDEAAIRQQLEQENDEVRAVLEGGQTSDEEGEGEGEGEGEEDLSDDEEADVEVKRRRTCA